MAMKNKFEQKPQSDLGASLPSDAIQCISGLVYQVLRPGKGDAKPGPDDIVRVLIKPQDQSESSVAGNAPQTFVVKEVSAGLAEAFQLMAVGGRMRIWLPASLAPSVPRNDSNKTLVLEVELLDFTRTKDPPSIPHELTSPQRKE